MIGTRLHRIKLWTISGALAATASLSAQTRVATPDLILHHGHIFTGDLAHPWAEAISIVFDHILAVGTDATIQPTAGPRTRLIDLQGRMAMPGVNDSHDHVGGASTGVEAQTTHPPMADPSLQELAEAIRTAAAAAPSGDWIHAVVGTNTIRHPQEARAIIDAAGAGHPVLLEAWWGHGVILNGQALTKLAIGDSVNDPQGGHWDRDAQGHLTGLAEEYAGHAIRRRLATDAGVPASVTRMRAYAQRRLSEGVTSVQVMATNETLSEFRQTFRQANVPLRFRIMRFPMPDEDKRVGERLASGEEILTPLVRIAGVKWVLDGTPLEQLAYSTKEYPNRPGWHGRPNFSREFIDQQLKNALNGKDQLMLHIVGDAMTDQVLDEMEKIAPAARWHPLRVRIEHADGFTTSERDARAKKLGLVIAQPRPGRPFRALREAGIPLAYGSDDGMTPFFMLAQMTDTHNPNAITREEALRVLTIGSSFAEFEEKKKGTLVPGMLADVAVLSQDVMTAPTEALPGTRSLLTLVGGKIAYSSPDFAEPAVRKERDSRHPLCAERASKQSIMPPRLFQ